jgi:hypothetical protein
MDSPNVLPRRSVALSFVIPAKAGIQGERQSAAHEALDSRFRGNDEREERGSPIDEPPLSQPAAPVAMPANRGYSISIAWPRL